MPAILPADFRRTSCADPSPFHRLHRSGPASGIVRNRKVMGRLDMKSVQGVNFA